MNPTSIAGENARGSTVHPLSYTLDETNAIIAVTGNWDRFAAENGGDDLLSMKIIGQRLDRFIAGDVTRMFVRTMLMSARTLKRNIQRTYRCDSPQIKRFMEMTIVPLGDGVLEVCHRHIRSEPYRYAVAFTPAAAGTTTGLIKRCSVCNRVRLRQSWRDADDALLSESPPAAGATTQLTVIYGVCPDCLARNLMSA
jgi:hypothetical protein